MKQIEGETNVLGERGERERVIQREMRQGERERGKEKEGERERQRERER